MNDRDKVILKLNGMDCEIDILLKDIIQKLNDKGYLTKYCCSSHLDDLETYTCSYGYIGLEDGFFVDSPLLKGCPYITEWSNDNYITWEIHSEEEQKSVIDTLSKVVDSLVDFEYKGQTPGYYVIIIEKFGDKKAYLTRGFSSSRIYPPVDIYHEKVVDIYPLDRYSVYRNCVFLDEKKMYKLCHREQIK